MAKLFAEYRTIVPQWVRTALEAADKAGLVGVEVSFRVIKDPKSSLYKRECLDLVGIRVYKSFTRVKYSKTRYEESGFYLVEFGENYWKQGYPMPERFRVSTLEQVVSSFADIKAISELSSVLNAADHLLSALGWMTGNEASKQQIEEMRQPFLDQYENLVKKYRDWQ